MRSPIPIIIYEPKRQHQVPTRMKESVPGSGIPKDYKNTIQVNTCHITNQERKNGSAKKLNSKTPTGTHLLVSKRGKVVEPRGICGDHGGDLPDAVLKAGASGEAEGFSKDVSYDLSESGEVSMVDGVGWDGADPGADS